MGFFTFTDARCHPDSISKIRGGTYAKSDIINYDGYARLLCPTGADIIETSYEGYGIFGGHDVYELVTEWNRTHLKRIFSELADTDKAKSDSTFPQIRKAAEIYACCTADEHIDAAIKQNISDPHIRQRWKRCIGIAIAYGENNLRLPYPIKITKWKSKGRYDTLYPSLVTQ